MPARMSETNTATLKEALAAQQFLLQKLYNELDAEREASSSAASETLSMILRLQGEKAAMKMEAEQYKRLAEEKMCYAEESIQIFEDIIYQKEMEIASLDYQVQAYRYKLLSLGCNDPRVGELKFPENLLQRNETLIGETSAQSISRRNSAPPAPFKFPNLKNKGNVELEMSENPESDMNLRVVEEHTKAESDMNLRVVEEHTKEEFSDPNPGCEKLFDVSAIGNKTSYWEQIKILDQQVKKIAGEEYGNLRNGSRSLSQISQASNTSELCDNVKNSITNKADQLKHPNTLLENTIHDVFEVPRTSKIIYSGDCKAEYEGKINLQVKEYCGEPEEIPNEAIKQYLKDQANSLSEMILPKNYKPNVCQPCDGMSIDDHLAVVPPTIGFSESQDMVQQVNMTSEIVEMRQPARQIPTNTNGEDGLKLLNEIQEQLKSIRSEIQNLKPKKSSPRDDLSMASLKEAMLHFWL